MDCVCNVPPRLQLKKGELKKPEDTLRTFLASSSDFFACLVSLCKPYNPLIYKPRPP